MDFQKLNYLVAVAELKSFSKAAERCFVSQPALTRSIQSIEDEIGIKLFDRSKSPVRLTYAGEHYLAGIQEILTLQNRLDKEMEEIALRKKDRLTVGIPHNRGANWVPRIFPSFYREYPDVDVQLVEADSSKLERMLDTEEIDLFVMGTDPILTKGIEMIPLYKEEMCVIVSRQADALNKYQLPPNQFGVLQYLPPDFLERIPFISAMPSQCTYHLAHRIFDEYNLNVKSPLENINASITYLMAPLQKGFAFGPATVTYEENFNPEPIFCSITDEPIFRMAGILYKAARKRRSSVEAFIQTASQIIVDYANTNVPSFQVHHDIDFTLH